MEETCCHLLIRITPTVFTVKTLGQILPYFISGGNIIVHRCKCYIEQGKKKVRKNINLSMSCFPSAFSSWSNVSESSTFAVGRAAHNTRLLELQKPEVSCGPGSI